MESVAAMPTSPLEFERTLGTLKSRVLTPPESGPKLAAGPQPRRSIFDLVLRDSEGVDALLLDESTLSATLQKLLLLSLGGLLMHGLLLGFVHKAILWNGLDPATRTFLGGHPMISLPIAYIGAFMTALGVCLPTFYFFTQLSGLDASFRLVTAQAVRVMARTAVLLLGVLPFYAALSLSHAVSALLSPYTISFLGFALPFLVGLLGIAALYRSFRTLLTVLPITHERRGRFLLRLVLAWGAVYSAVAPVALFRFIEALGRGL